MPGVRNGARKQLWYKASGPRNMIKGQRGTSRTVFTCKFLLPVRIFYESLPVDSCLFNMPDSYIRQSQVANLSPSPKMLLKAINVT